jgi:acetyl/propionyl-CoA carboxylase alpha subunit
VIAGVSTNVGLHRWLLGHPVFRSANYDTRFLEQHFHPSELVGDPQSERVALLAASLHEWQKSHSVTLPRRPSGRWRWAQPATPERRR